MSLQAATHFRDFRLFRSAGSVVAEFMNYLVNDARIIRGPVGGGKTISCVFDCLECHCVAGLHRWLVSRPRRCDRGDRWLSRATWQCGLPKDGGSWTKIGFIIGRPPKSWPSPRRATSSPTRSRPASPTFPARPIAQRVEFPAYKIAMEPRNGSDDKGRIRHDGWPRKQSRITTKFDMTLDRSVGSLRDEIGMLGRNEALLTYNGCAQWYPRQ